MANSQIVWNANTLNFPDPLSNYDYRRRADRRMAISHGQVVATSLRALFDEAKIELLLFTNATFEADLRAWWDWAARGKQYSFALDSGLNQDKTLNANAAVGATSLTLNNVTGLTVGQKCLLREAAGDEEEIVEIASITSPSVGLVAGTKFDYVIGDVFRAREYFPKVVSLDEDYPVKQNLTTWSLSHRFREDRG